MRNWILTLSRYMQNIIDKEFEQRQERWQLKFLQIKQLKIFIWLELTDSLAHEQLALQAPWR